MTDDNDGAGEGGAGIGPSGGSYPQNDSGGGDSTGGEGDSIPTGTSPYLGTSYLGTGYVGVGTLARPAGSNGPDAPEQYPLGEYPDLVESIAPRGPDTPRGRLNTSIKSPPFPVSDITNPTDSRYSNWDGYLHTLADEAVRVSHARSETSLARYVDTAKSGALDNLGDFVDTPRTRDETDAHYRARLKLQLRVSIGGGTIADVKEAAAAVLETSPEAVAIDEPFSDEPARMDLAVQRDDLESADIELGEFVDVIGDVKAAGVRVFGLVLGGFTHRSQADYDAGINDVDRAYATSYDPETGERSGGGEYSSLLYREGSEVTI